MGFLPWSAIPRNGIATAAIQAPRAHMRQARQGEKEPQKGRRARARGTTQRAQLISIGSRLVMLEGNGGAAESMTADGERVRAEKKAFCPIAVY